MRILGSGNLREGIALSLVAVSLLLGMTRLRVFPFSDFPLYAYVLPNPTILTLMSIEEDGTQKILSNAVIRPLTRIHLNQTLKTLRAKNESPAATIQWILDRVKRNNPRVVSVAVVRLQFGDEPDLERGTYPILNTEILNDVPIK